MLSQVRYRGCAEGSAPEDSLRFVWVAGDASVVRGLLALDRAAVTTSLAGEQVIREQRRADRYAASSLLNTSKYAKSPVVKLLKHVLNACSLLYLVHAFFSSRRNRCSIPAGFNGKTRSRCFSVIRSIRSKPATCPVSRA